MSMRCDTDDIIASAMVCGDRGLGVTGQTILDTTSTGTYGPGFLYACVDGGDGAKEFRGLIVTPPSAGNFIAYEDGSFDLIDAPDGAYSFIFELFVDGVSLGTQTSYITIGSFLSAALSVSGIGAFAATGRAITPTIFAVAGRGTFTPARDSSFTLTPDDIQAIVNAVWSDPRALTVGKFLALK